MDEKKIARINQLAAKAKTPEGLTQEEREEQLRLRREYIDSVVGNLWWMSTATSASSAGRESSDGLFL
mgnify:CR=1 FL=1